MEPLIQLNTKVDKVNIRSVERRFLGINDFSDYLGVPKGTFTFGYAKRKFLT